MSHENPEDKLTNEGQPPYLMIYDRSPITTATRVRLEINLDAIAENRELGTKFLRGALEEFKNELLAVVGEKRKYAAKAGIVIPKPGLKVVN